jgi:hypothetical protein
MMSVSPGGKDMFQRTRTAIRAPTRPTPADVVESDAPVVLAACGEFDSGGEAAMPSF